MVLPLAAAHPGKLGLCTLFLLVRRLPGTRGGAPSSGPELAAAPALLGGPSDPLRDLRAAAFARPQKSYSRLNASRNILNTATSSSSLVSIFHGKASFCFQRHEGLDIRSPCVREKGVHIALHTIRCGANNGQGRV